MKIEYKSTNITFTNQTNNLINGYASIFNIVDAHDDLVIPGAFTNSLISHLAGKTIPLLWQHKQDTPIGKIEHLLEDENGLFIKATILQETNAGREALAMINSGLISGLSIGYIPTRWSYGDDGVRILEDIDLLEVSLVTFPANHLAGILPFPYPVSY